MNDYEIFKKIQLIYGQSCIGEINKEVALKQLIEIVVIRINQIDNTDKLQEDSIYQIALGFISLLNERLISDIYLDDYYLIKDKYIPKTMLNYYINHVVSRLKQENKEFDIYENELYRSKLHNNILNYANEKRGSKWSRILDNYIQECILEKL